MADYKMIVDKNGNPMYFADGTRIAPDKVPAEVLAALQTQPPETVINDKLELVTGEDPEEEAPESTEAPEVEGDSEGETDEEDDGIEDLEEAREISQQHPVQGSSDDSKKPMGFRTNAQGQTLSIFSNNVHETVKFVYGIMVPMTFKELAEKTDGDIGKALRKLGKL